jgi:hypothetical protein
MNDYMSSETFEERNCGISEVLSEDVMRVLMQMGERRITTSLSFAGFHILKCHTVNETKACPGSRRHGVKDGK